MSEVLDIEMFTNESGLSCAVVSKPDGLWTRLIEAHASLGNVVVFSEVGCYIDVDEARSELLGLDVHGHGRFDGVTLLEGRAAAA